MKKAAFSIISTEEGISTWDIALQNANVKLLISFMLEGSFMN